MHLCLLYQQRLIREQDKVDTYHSIVVSIRLHILVS